MRGDWPSPGPYPAFCPPTSGAPPGTGPAPADAHPAPMTTDSWPRARPPAPAPPRNSPAPGPSTPAPSVTVQQRPAPALPVPAPPLVRTVSPRPKHRYRGGTPTPPSCYMLEWHPTSKISSMTFFPQEKAWSKNTPPDGTQAQKFSHEKFFWDLDDGGHRAKVGKPLKASSDGRWSRSWLSAKPRDWRGGGGLGLHLMRGHVA